MSHREASLNPKPLLIQPVLASGSATLPLGSFNNLGRESSGHEPFLQPLLYRMAAATLVALALAVLTLLSISAHAESPDASGVPSATESAELEKRLAAIESAIEEKRKSLGVQGASLVIVKDN